MNAAEAIVAYLRSKFIDIEVIMATNVCYVSWNDDQFSCQPHRDGPTESTWSD